MDFIDALRLPVRAGLAAGVAYWAAEAMGLGGPIYALVSAVVVTEVDAAHTRKLALPRMLGTLVGAAVGTLAALSIPARPLMVAAGVAAAMVICGLLRVPAAARVAGYVSGILMVGFAVDPWAHARDRIGATLVGIVAAALVSLVPLLLPPRQGGTPS